MALPCSIEIGMERYSGGRLEPGMLTVNTEYPVAMVVNGRHLSTIACSGDDLEKLTAGYLFAERIIMRAEQIVSFAFDEKTLIVQVSVQSEAFDREKHRPEQIMTGGGKARKNVPEKKFIHGELPWVKADVICRAAAEFLNFSKLHELTHGVHSAGLYTLDGSMIVFFDEIGRHNAIDKVVGHAMMNSIPLEKTMLFSTGRISSEIAGKVIHSGIPVFISRASPTSYAVELLRNYNVLSVCRARDDGFFVINGKECIIP
jgi:FdhD protein